MKKVAGRFNKPVSHLTLMNKHRARYLNVFMRVYDKLCLNTLDYEK